ncbi:FimV/HubP family polar landmark protein [Paraburkholderia flagellata]|uniref:FimV/HubP family polar landmark protein n=1 Tax=Paraburkholderia flagellata TaxID=2883241 RepID=UPI001F419170|nr:FimV/HubP family polar landmark protein [Paraburkholderia flagellata]
MIVRFDSVSAAPRAKRAQGRRAIRATVAAASFLFCGLAAAQGGASAAPGTASAASSAAAAVSVAGQYTVRPGQSLHDVAVDVTQSHDKATLARMSQALFDANPNAFIKQDPSRMRVGATLNVPATPDVSSAAAGMTVASGGAAAASAGASAAASTPAAAATVPAASTASASAPAAASSAAAEAVAAASSAAAAATAGASSASAAAATAAPASAVAASGPEASTQGASGAATGASAAAPASAASDSHVWSGSIQSVPAPASGAAGASAQGAKVSSLQQLLALKNRVLMALQQHGIGKPAQTTSGASAGAPAAQGGAPVQNGVVNAGAAGGQPEVSPVAMGAVTAVVVALLALFVRLLMRKRKKPPVDQASEVSPEAHEPTPSTSSATAAAAVPVAEEPPVLREPITHAGHQPDAHALAPAAQAEFAPPVAPEADEVAITPVPTPDVSSAPLEHDETAAQAASAAGVNTTTTGLEAEALPPTLTETLHPGTPQEPSVAQEAHAAQALPHGVEPGEPQTLADAAEAASLAAAAELGADALPPESIGAPRAAEDAEALARTLEEPARAQKPAAPDIALDFGDGAPQAAQTQQAPQAEPPVTEAFERPPAPLTAPEIPSVPAVTAEEMSYAEVPIAFPHDAIEALGGLDLPLPPRIGEPVIPTEPLSTEPAATPEASARLSSPFFEPPPSMAGAAIEAGTAGAGALAGLGAPRFGALTLDFDLNLPPDSAEPLPVFTPEQLARIARNKLDLAHEYIALGDVSGARSLINEVIESNDPATRSDAQALLSTLAPLS